MTMTATYRKCLKCGSSTNDLHKTKCNCGGYLYLISTIYTPKVRQKEESRND